MPYIVVTPIKHDGRPYQVGEFFDTEDTRAVTSLLESGAIKSTEPEEGGEEGSRRKRRG